MLKMFHFVVFLCVTVFLGAQASWIPNNGRIINGTNANISDIPYIVSVRYDFAHLCAGTILDEYHILTTSHCLDTVSSRLTIQYGVSKISSDHFQIIRANYFWMHEKYDPFTLINDVAVIELELPLHLGQNVKPVMLPAQGEVPPLNQWGFIAGWGASVSQGQVVENLQRLDVLIYTDEACTEAYPINVNKEYNICAGIPEGGKGQCNGDAGGPLIARNGKQYGIVSWSEKPCASRGRPGVFTRLPNYINWINSKIALHNAL